MRGLSLFLLVTSVAGTCDICEPWSGAVKPDAILHKQCKSGSTEIDGTFPDLAACKAAGGTTLTDLMCGTTLSYLANQPQYQDKEACATIQAAYGAMCCAGQYTGTMACDICQPWSGELQPDKVFHKTCKNGTKEFDGMYGDLASCKAVGGTSLQEFKCNYMYTLGNSPEMASTAKCKEAQSSHGAKCCGGHYTGTKACDICVAPTGSMCMYNTPSGCTKHPQYSTNNAEWKAWIDSKEASDEAACPSLAAKANEACGVSDSKTKWGTLPSSAKKCVQNDKVFHKSCVKLGGAEVDGSFADLAACKAAGGVAMNDVTCSYMYALMNSPEMADKQKCSSTKLMYGPQCCTAAACPPDTSTTNGVKVGGIAMALGCAFVQIWDAMGLI